MSNQTQTQFSTQLPDQIFATYSQQEREAPKLTAADKLEMSENCNWSN